MKRCLCIVTGIVLFLAMVILPGLDVNGATALAAGDSKPAAGSQPVIVKKDHPPVNQAASLRESFSEAKTAATNQNIYSNRTLSGTYNRNIVVKYGATVTIRGNVTINGNLDLDGGKLNITAGTLKVNGRIYIGCLSRFTASGYSKVIVNKAMPKRDKDQGGYVVVDGDGFASDTGMLSLIGGVTMTVNNMTNGGFYSWGTVKMAAAASGKPKLVVNAIDCVFEGCSTYGLLTAGTLEVHGNFFQNDSSAQDLGFEPDPRSYCPGAGFNTVFVSTPSVMKYVSFDLYANSYVTNYAFTKGFKFMPGSTICIFKDITADAMIDCTNATVAYTGNLNGHKLTIKGVEVYPLADTTLAIGSGALTINGKFNIGSNNAGIRMDNAAGKLIVNGDFAAWGSAAPTPTSTSTLSAGSIDMNGNFTSGDFKPGPSFSVRILGANRLIQCDADICYFTNFQLAPGASLHPDSLISLKCSLTGDMTFNYPHLYLQGTLNGHKLVVPGDLTVPMNSLLTVGGGTLVADSMMVLGNLVMTNYSDVVVVKGDFQKNEAQSTGMLTNGRLYVGGAFSANSCFTATGNHTTVFNGHGDDQDTYTASFAHLVVTNDNFNTAKLTTYSNSELVIGGGTFSGIDTTAGALYPAFDPALRNYALYLPEGTDSVVITPHLLGRYEADHESMTVTVEGGAAVDNATQAQVTGVPVNGSKLVTVDVYVFNGAYNTKANPVEKYTYTIKVETLNPNLKDGIGGLGPLPAGTSAGYDGAAHAYTVDLPATAASLPFFPVADNRGAMVTIDGAAAPQTIAVPLGNSKTCAVKVTAQDGKTAKDYSVTFRRRSPLSGISLSSGTLSFDPATANYTVSVPPTTDSIAVNITGSADCGRIDIDGVNQNNAFEASKTLPVAPGTDASATVTAWDADGKSTTTYTVTIKCGSMLSGIALSTGTLSPAFARQTTSYSVYLPNTTASVVLTPQKAFAESAMTINGAAVSSLALSPAAGGSSTAEVVCTFGTVTQAYTVTVYRIMPVSKIGVSAGALSPAFRYTTCAYTVNLPVTASSITLSVTRTDSLKSLTVDGSDMAFNASGVGTYTVVPAVGGINVVKIVATAQNGVKTTYTVTVKRALLLSGIKLSAGALSPSFNPAVLAYTVTVPSTTTQVKVTPVKARTGVKSITINGRAATYATIKLPVGGSATATIVATASDGKTKVTYTVTVKRAALVTGIRLSTGTLSPAFSARTSAYTVTIPATVPSVTITPVKGSNVRTLTMNGKAVTSLPVSPTLTKPVTVMIAAVATDRVTKFTYTLTVRQQAPLTGITVTDGSLSQTYPITPTFSSGRMNYDVYVPENVESVTIGAAAAPGCTYAVDGGAADTPQPVTVEIGGSATATITAGTSSGGTPAVYKVTVHRADLLTGIGVSSGTLAFSPGINDYVVHVAFSSEPVVITPTASATCKFTIDGEAVPSKTVLPEEGESVLVSVIATNADGSVQKTYVVTIHRVMAPLFSLSCDWNLTMTPDFNSVDRSYVVMAYDYYGSVTITAIPAEGNTLKMNGRNVTSLTFERPDDDSIASVVDIVVKQQYGLPDVQYDLEIWWADWE